MVERLTLRGGRYYRILETNETFPSVTTVLSVIGKKFLPRWEAKLAVSKFRSRLDQRLRDGTLAGVSESDIEAWSSQAQNEPHIHLNAAGGFGTDAHILFESLLNGEEAKVAPEYEAVVHNFVTWRAKLDPPLEVVSNEKIV